MRPLLPLRCRSNRAAASGSFASQPVLHRWPASLLHGTSSVSAGSFPARNTSSTSSIAYRPAATFTQEADKMLKTIPHDAGHFVHGITLPHGLAKVQKPQDTPDSAMAPLKLPPGTWDSHMHVIVPSKYPVLTTAQYQPSSHTIAEAIAFEKRLGIQNMVLVQPSVYGLDNSCLLDALKQLGPTRGRGIVVLDPWKTQPDQLKEWHSLGVRGIRINLKSADKTLSRNELESVLLRYAELLRPLDWVIQLYLPMEMMNLLEDIVPRLRIRICLDHFGSPPVTALAQKSRDPRSISGFDSLLRLLVQGNTWVKISAPYRLSQDRAFQDLERIFHQLAAVAPDKLLFATDWPHTRFNNVNVRPFASQCLQWAAQHDIVDRVFRDTAQELWK